MRYREWFIISDGKYTLRLSRDGYLHKHSTLHGTSIIECELIGFRGLFGLWLRVCCHEGWWGVCLGLVAVMWVTCGKDGNR